jgi:hypothetical protein
MSTTMMLNETVVSTNENIHVKLQFNEEFRRFFIPKTNPPIKFFDLESKIKTLLKITENEIVIKYQDEENEWITISSDTELETGLIIGNGQLFRLLCVIKDNNNNNNNNNTTGEDEMVPHWKKNRRENFPKRDKKWKKKNCEKGGNPCELENLTPEPTSCNLHEDNANEDNEPKKWKRERRQKKEKPRGKRDRREDGERRRKKNRDDDDDESNGSSSESNSDIALLTLEEIKVELSKLKEEANILKEKVRAAKESWKVAKESVNVKRREENVLPDVILSMREDMTNKQNEKNKLQAQLRNTRCRMNKLREAAQTKQV